MSTVKSTRLGPGPEGPPEPCLACNTPIYRGHIVTDVTVFLDLVPEKRKGCFWFNRHRCDEYRHVLPSY